MEASNGRIQWENPMGENLIGESNRSIQWEQWPAAEFEMCGLEFYRFLHSSKKNDRSKRWKIVRVAEEQFQQNWNNRWTEFWFWNWRDEKEEKYRIWQGKKNFVQSQYEVPTQVFAKNFVR